MSKADIYFEEAGLLHEMLAFRAKRRHKLSPAKAPIRQLAGALSQKV